MRTTKILYFLFLTFLAQFINAQDSIINRNITVEREYKPIIQDAGKINSMPEVLEPKTEKTAAVYSNFNLPLTVDFNIHTLPSADLEREKRYEDKGGFARIGFGNYFNSLADFAYPLVKKPDVLLDVSLKHLATFGKKAHSNTNGIISFDKKFKKFNLFAGIGGGHEYLAYYGNEFNSTSTINLDTLLNKVGLGTYTETNRTGKNSSLRNFQLADLANDSASNTFWRFNAFAGFKTVTLKNEWQYQAQLKYNSLSTGYGNREHQIRTLADINTLYYKNKIGVGIELNNMIYNATTPNFWNFANAYSVLTLNPYYNIERKNWNVRLGAKSSFNFEAQNFLAYPSADIKAEWRVLPRNISVYGGITGGLKTNTLSDIYIENPYLQADIRVRDTYTPFNLYAGVKAKPFSNILVDAFIDYKKIYNQYFFVNKEYAFPSNPLTSSADFLLYTNRFDVIYSDASVTKIGVRASYNLQNIVSVEFKGAYNAWNVKTETYAWNKPTWEADFNTQLHVNKNLTVSAIAFFEGERYAKLGSNALRMRPKVDINLGANYLHNKWLSSFVKINNLINNPYQEFYGYQLQGFNVLVGASVSF